LKAIAYKSNLAATDPDSLIDIEIPTLKAEAFDLLVEIHATSVNPVDTKIRLGVPQNDNEFKVLGWDACGVVVAIGDKSEGFKIGDRVWYAGQLDRQGSNAEFQLVDSRIASIAPHILSAPEAAAMPLTSITAWESLFERLGYTEQPSEWNKNHPLLIINGAGGVGSIALQLCRLAEIPVMATASRKESQEWCKTQGATQVINHNDLSTWEESSFSRILCCHDTDQYFEIMCRLIAPLGLICGLSSTHQNHDIKLLMNKSAGFVWEFIFTKSLSEMKMIDMSTQRLILKKIAKLVEAGLLSSTLSYELTGLTSENLRLMHQKQESGLLIGKQALMVKT
jgi:NADPH2:quinone reductase